MCLDLQLAHLLKAIGKETKERLQYAVRVDWFEIAQLALPILTKNERDAVREIVSQEYFVPRHFLKMGRKFYGA